MPLPGTPLHEVCRAADLLLPPGVEQQVWPLGRLNVKEHPDGLSRLEMCALADEIMAMLERGNARDL
jgi:hypothetical protein